MKLYYNNGQVSAIKRNSKSGSETKHLASDLHALRLLVQRLLRAEDEWREASDTMSRFSGISGQSCWVTADYAKVQNRWNESLRNLKKCRTDIRKAMKGSSG